jgi:hypothetical protein
VDRFFLRILTATRMRFGTNEKSKSMLGTTPPAMCWKTGSAESLDAEHALFAGLQGPRFG